MRFGSSPGADLGTSITWAPGNGEKLMEGRAGRKLESCCCSQSLAEAEAARGCPCCPSRHAGSPWGRDSHLGMLQGQSAERHAWLKSCRSGKGGADAGLERPWGGLGAAEQGTGLARQIYSPEPSDPVTAVCHGVCERVPVRGGTVTPTQPGEASCGRVGWVGPATGGSGAPKRVHGVEEGRARQSRDGGAPPGSVGRSSSLLSTAQPCSAPETRQRVSPWLFQLETRVESSFFPSAAAAGVSVQAGKQRSHPGAGWSPPCPPASHQLG